MADSTQTNVARPPGMTLGRKLLMAGGIAVAATLVYWGVQVLFLQKQTLDEDSRPPIVVNNGSIDFTAQPHSKGRGKWKDDVTTAKWRLSHSGKAPTYLGIEGIKNSNSAGCSSADVYEASSLVLTYSDGTTGGKVTIDVSGTTLPPFMSKHAKIRLRRRQAEGIERLHADPAGSGLDAETGHTEDPDHAAKRQQPAVRLRERAVGVHRAPVAQRLAVFQRADRIPGRGSPRRPPHRKETRCGQHQGHEGKRRNVERAERAADRDLALALFGRIRDHAIDAEDDENAGEQRKAGEHRREEARAGEQVGGTAERDRAFNQNGRVASSTMSRAEVQLKVDNPPGSGRARARRN